MIIIITQVIGASLKFPNRATLLLRDNGALNVFIFSIFLEILTSIFECVSVYVYVDRLRNSLYIALTKNVIHKTKS